MYSKFLLLSVAIGGANAADVCSNTDGSVANDFGTGSYCFNNFFPLYNHAAYTSYKVKTLDDALKADKTALSLLKVDLVSEGQYRTKLTTRVSTLEDALKADKTALSLLKVDLVSEGQYRTKLTTRVSTLETQLASLVTGVQMELASMKTKLASVATKVANVESYVATNATKLIGVGANVATNAAGVKSNGADIAAKGTQIVALESDVKAQYASISEVCKATGEKAARRADSTSDDATSAGCGETSSADKASTSAVLTIGVTPMVVAFVLLFASL